MCLKLDNYFRPKKNITYERYIFKEAKQKQHETTMCYVTRLRSLAESCSFHNLSESVKDQFISSCYSTKLKQKLLTEKSITLEKGIQIGRDMEVARKKEMSETVAKQNTEQLNAVKFNKSRSPKKYQPHRNKTQKSQTKPQKPCYRCGDIYNKNHNDVCRAMGRECYKCNKKNHLASCCRSNNPVVKQKPSENVHEVYYSDADSSVESSEESFAVSYSSSAMKTRKTKSVTAKIENVNVNIMIDTGSSVNLIDKNTYDKIYKRNESLKLKKTTTNIFPYESHPLKLSGYFQASIETNKRFSTSKFYVVNNATADNIMGIETAK